MILLCDRDVTVHAHHAREPLCEALAYALYERLAAEGDTPRALRAMGELYAMLTLPLRQVSPSVRVAAEILTARHDPERFEGESPSGGADDGPGGSGDGNEGEPAGGCDAKPGTILDAAERSPFSDQLLLVAANRVGCAVVGCRGRGTHAPHDDVDDAVALLEEEPLDPRLADLLC